MQLAIEKINSNQVTQIVSGKGNLLGSRIMFAQPKSAKEIKASLKLKDPTLKGTKLNDAVGEVLRGESDIRWVESDIARVCLKRAGYVPLVVDAKATSAIERFGRPKVAVKAADATQAELEVALAASLGMDVEDLRAMTAMAKK